MRAAVASQLMMPSRQAGSVKTRDTNCHSLEMASGIQLWVNLPAELKLSPPRYQAITNDALRLLTTDGGGALLRLIAGEGDGFEGPG